MQEEESGAGAQWLAGGASWPCLLQSLAPPDALHTNPLTVAVAHIFSASLGSSILPFLPD